VIYIIYCSYKKYCGIIIL